MIDRFDLKINMRMFKMGYVFIIMFLPISRFYYYLISYRFSDSFNGVVLFCLWWLCFYIALVLCLPDDISFIHYFLTRTDVFKIKNRKEWYSFIWKKKR